MSVCHFFLLTSETLYVEESGSPYDLGSLTGTVETILLTPQQHGIPMQTSGRKRKQIVSIVHAILVNTAIVLFHIIWKENQPLFRL